MLLVLSFSVIGLTLLASITGRDSFRPYFGNINPVIAILLIVLLGYILLTYLSRRGWFVFHAGKGLWIALVVPTVLAALIVMVDYRVTFPETLNVRFPQSMLFYPTIAYVVEVVFHLLPLTLMLVLATSIFRSTDITTLMMVSAVTVALIEPIYQTLGFVGDYPAWVVIYVFVHVLVFNLCQMMLFIRYGFVSMFVFRLTYYALWHILWGHFRLQVLF